MIFEIHSQSGLEIAPDGGSSLNSSNFI